jgi:hypothetical protein
MNFLVRAEALGHDIKKLEKGETIESLVTVATLDDYKQIFGGNLADQERYDFSKNLEDLQDGPEPMIEPLRNLMDYVYGNRELTPEDVIFAGKIFPIQVRAVSAADFPITTDIQVGPAAAPYVINAGTLTFNGGSLSVLNTVCQIAADNLVVQGGGDRPYQVGIFGAPGAAGGTGAAGSTTPGPAPNGQDAGSGSPGVCTGRPNGGDGSNGAAGGKGVAGQPGGPGLASLNAQIKIAALDPSGLQSFVVTTQSGQGGAGGTGGAGGAGQEAGNGGNGCSTGCEGTDGGNGGAGGAGGDGGPGGSGGPGTAGLPIQITFPLAAKAALVANSSLAPPGPGGAGGPGGEGGGGGSGGGSGKHRSNGSNGSAGAGGSQGATGAPGSQNGQAGQYSYSWI